MTKQQKMFLGIGLITVAAIALLAFKPKTTPAVVSNQGGGQDDQNACPAGEKPCANNPTKCYNPNLNYIVDPCTFGV
jgi:hypothetical protein